MSRTGNLTYAQSAAAAGLSPIGAEAAERRINGN